MAPALSPEECYQRALKAIDAGQLPRAIKFLKVASLKDPADARFRDALHQAQAALKASKEAVSTVDPQALLAEARALQEAGDLKGARQILQIALARAPRDKEIRAAFDALREGRAVEPPPTEEQKTRKTLSELASAATEDVSAPPKAAAPAAAPVSRGRLIALVAVLLLSAGLSGAVFLMGQTSHATDAGPYAAFLPVQDARAVGVNSEELVLVIPGKDWAALGEDARRTKLKQVLGAAQSAGHEAIFVYDEERALLGSASPELVYLR